MFLQNIRFKFPWHEGDKPELELEFPVLRLYSKIFGGS